MKKHRKYKCGLFILIGLAWNNVFYNKSRTALVVLLVGIAFSSIALFRGYTRYSAEGMKLGYIEKSGNFRIAPNGFWSDGDSEILFEKDELQALIDLLQSINTVNTVRMVNPIIEFSGIIGNERNSQIFWGEAREYPNIGVTAGVPLFQGDDGILIGSGLAKKLGVSLDNKNESFVNVMSQTYTNGISLASFDVAGIIDTGVPQNDEGLVIASRKAVLEFLGFENTASFVEVRLASDGEQDGVIQYIKDEMAKYNFTVEIKTWMDLNPSFAEVNAMNMVQQTILTIIFCVLIFTALIQALSAAFKERLYEFGMLEAVGLKKGNICFLLVMEVFFLSFIAIAFGLLLTWMLSEIISILPITLYFPGYSEGYKLFFVFTAADIVEAALFIFVTCILAMFGPVAHILRFQIAHLMYHSV